MSKLLLAFVVCCMFIVNGIEGSVDIQKLFDSLDIEDKCGQMTQVTVEILQKSAYPGDLNEGVMNETLLREAIVNKRVGSLLGTPFFYALPKDIWQHTIRLIHDIGLNESKHKIPILFGIDSIHGATFVREAVVFPQPLAMACTFNEEIARGIGEVTSIETRAVGIPWNFNPVLDIGRQPLWPRLYETYGEDVHLAIKMGESYINGHQERDLANKTKAATCLKHYIGYSFPFNGRDRTQAYIPDVLLREYFLPTFEHAVEAGSLSVMVNSGTVNGIPGHANSYYINDILKGELKFEGFVVSDWQDIERLYTRDKVAESPEEAVRMAVMAGLDMSMVPYEYSFIDHCVNLAKKDTDFASRVDDATMRILKFKQKVGIFDNPYPSAADLDRIGTQRSHDLNLQAARESIVLAKNENNILPLDKSKKILVAGPSGNLLKILCGGWTYVWQGNNETAHAAFGGPKSTIYQAIKSHANDAQYLEGATFTDVTNLDETVQQAQKSDVVILCIGEDTYTETPGNINSLMMSDSQFKLADALFKTGKPVIVVYVGGRPRVITDVAEKADAVLIGFLPGTKGSDAIADILFGAYNPNGRLALSYPRFPNGFTPYDRTSLDEYEQQNKYRPLYSFGHGLSYTQFTYSDLKLSTDTLIAPNELNVQVTVQNTGNMDGKEVVMLYINQEYGSVPRPIVQLKKFQKIDLKKGERKTLSFSLTMYDLSFINLKSERDIESGDLHVYIANLTAPFSLVDPNEQTTPIIPPNSSNRSFAPSYYSLFILLICFYFF